jgi:hypothetical protein
MPAPDVPESGSAAEPLSALIAEVTAFQGDCDNRYRFNSRWDNVLSVTGILLSVAIVAAGTFHKAELATILGSLVAAIVTAQRAFPFGSRAQFYRVLIGQTANLLTDLRSGVAIPSAIATLKSLRLDFAQQLPRGTTMPDASSPKQS